MMKPLIQLFVFALLLSGCNDLNDLRPVDPATEIPEAAVKVVKAKFPNAEELVFRPVVADKIWEVKLKSDAERYSSLVDFGKMWETFRLVSDVAPPVLEEALKKTAFSGGTLSAYSTSYFATTAPNKLIYNYKGENYSLEWSGVLPNVNGTASFDPSLYRITSYDTSELPTFVKDTIQANSGMKFVQGVTWIRLNNTKQYFIIGSLKVGSRTDPVHLIFDEKGALRWGSTLFSQPGLPAVASNLTTIPPQISQYIERQPELAGYEYEHRIVNDFNGLTSYFITVKVGGVSRCELYFDKDFNVLNKRYLMVLY